jgi:Tol biopolymer transport system component
MPLTVGTHLGSYEIMAPLGAGGMGEVYRARDRKLNRDVALKVLPDAFTQDPDRLARFTREAQVLASLNHSNIAAIYGLEDSNGVQALVLELVEGPTLADRIAKGPIPLAEALPIARQIAEALEAAHEHGIIHRDLKPANIKLRPDASVKVLDFGLAKALEPVSTDGANVTASPTITTPAMTQRGVVLGTAAYMSPEQARGATVDKRADVWAFGVVLYEMLTGRRPFEGQTVSDSLASVLKDQPSWDGLPPNARSLLRRCLEKDPKRRLHDLADARIEIDEVLASAATAEAHQAPARSPRPWQQARIAWSVAVVFLLAALALGFAAYRRRVADAPATVRSTILAPDGTFIGAPTITGQGLSLALSPNGRHLVFVATGSDNRSRLWLRSLDGNSAEPLAGTEDGVRPFWSPDSRSIAFFSLNEHKLKRVDITGRQVLTVYEDPQLSGGGGTWSADGVILFAYALVETNSPAILRVADSGGIPVPATTIDAKAERRHITPVFLPDGRHFLYTSIPTTGPLSVYMGRLDGPEKVLVFRDAANVQYVPGRLLFVRGTTLVAQPFDAERRVLTGEGAPIVEGLAIDTYSRTGVFSASATGVLAYQAGMAGGISQLTWFDRAGKATGVLSEPADYNSVNLSPDGTRAAVSLRDANRNMDVWIVDVARGVRTRLTFDPADDVIGVWSPDGRSIVFDSARTGRRDLYRKAANGSGSEDIIDASPISKLPTSWSSDGRFLLYNSGSTTPRTGNDLWVLPLVGQQKPYLFLQTSFNEGRAQFAPDGRWIAYASNESGRNEVYVASFPGPVGKWQVSTGGGGSPRWRHDGRELFYVALDGNLMTAAVNSRESVFEIGAVRPLFKPRMRDQFNGLAYDVTADGDRFLVNTLVDRTASSSITLIVNWPGLLTR